MRPRLRGRRHRALVSRRGIRTFAVDISPAMLRAARKKVRSAGLSVRVLRGDMRTFRLPEPVDLVTCECDAVNHAPQRGDFARVARAVSRAADRAWSDIEWFVRRGRLWERHRERVEEVAWTAAEVRRVLDPAGFDRVRSWDGAAFFKDNPLMTRGCRTIYLARKCAL